ncbi:MAG: GNAT family N-acetyltransferase [Cytophagaceae bacterium]|jgi:lipid II:glycine glycyltransferase (peptidoglycan interpeptide bridge formation enzyme)|nr:GNAT family N-acetyltransferase [Cytophagaceae bacterium]
MVAIHIVKIEEIPVCAFLCILFGDTFGWNTWGWNGEYAKEKLPEVVGWKEIEWAKKNGFKWFDFVSVDPESARAIEAGDEIQKKTFLSQQHGYRSSFIIRI